MVNYKITFENENVSYILKIENGSLVFENDQPNVTVTAEGATQLILIHSLLEAYEKWNLNV